MSERFSSRGVGGPPGIDSDQRDRRFVADLILDRFNTRMFFSAPYAGELHADGFAARIEPPARIPQGDVSPPLRIVHAGKEYFIPGSADDLVAYTSSVVACLPAILASLVPDAPEDCGPPSYRQMEERRCGSPAFVRSQWRRLDGRTQAHLATKRPVAVADVREFGRSVDTALVLDKLDMAGADPHALAHLRRLYSAWDAYGATGLPLTGCVSIMSKLVLAEADVELRRRNIDFTRIQDDYRIFAEDEDDASRAVEALREALRGLGLSLNPSKTEVLRPGAKSAATRRGLALQRLLRMGVVRPLLGDLLRWRLSRPLAIRALRVLYASQCTPFDRLSS